MIKDRRIPTLMRVFVFDLVRVCVYVCVCVCVFLMVEIPT
jgi:hypothetical protein